MPPELRTPIGIWIATSLVVAVVASRIEAGVYIAAPYLVLNGAALILGLIRNPPLSRRAAQVLAWCTAAQLPTMFMLFFDVEGNRSPRKQMERQAQQQLEANARRDGRPVTERERAEHRLSGTMNRRLSSTRMTVDRVGRPEPRHEEPDPG